MYVYKNELSSNYSHNINWILEFVDKFTDASAIFLKFQLINLEGLFSHEALSVNLRDSLVTK